VVAQGDLEGLFHPIVVIVDLKVGLNALAHDVKGVPNVEPDRLILGRVIDRILSDQKARTIDVLLENAQGSLGQRHAQPTLFRVLELEHDRHLGVGDRAVGWILDRLVGPPPAHVGAIVDKELFGGHLGPPHEFDLLGLLIFDRHRPLDLVQVVLKEAALLDWGGGGDCHLVDHLFFRRSPGHLDAVDIARHELELGLLVAGAALIVEGDPAVQIQRFLVV